MRQITWNISTVIINKKKNQMDIGELQNPVSEISNLLAEFKSTLNTLILFIQKTELMKAKKDQQKTYKLGHLAGSVRRVCDS